MNVESTFLLRFLGFLPASLPLREFPLCILPLVSSCKGINHFLLKCLPISFSLLLSFPQLHLLCHIKLRSNKLVISTW